MTVVPGITHCPVCEYDLHGLPARHTCPECGFDYNKNMQVYRPTRPLGSSVLWGLFGLCALISWIGQGMTARFPGLLVPLAGMLMLVPVVNDAVRRSRSRAILSPAGITIIRDASGAERIAWDMIAAVSFSRLDGFVRVRGFRDELLTELPYTFFGNYKTAKAFAAAAGVWLARVKQGSA